MTFAGDSALASTRWRAAPETVLGAYEGETLVGSNFVTRWGRFGFFGPLTVRPDLWNRGVAQKLLAPTMELFERWAATQRGLFTFAASEKHHALYGKFGFAKQAPTLVLDKPISPRGGSAGGWTAYMALTASERETARRDMRALTDEIFPGLDLTGEVAALERQGIGEVVLAYDGASLAGFAVCHVGAGSEAGSDAVYVKFAAARPGAGAERRFERLVVACEDCTYMHGMSRLSAGVNATREEALAIVRGRGFAAMMEGVAMQSPDQPGLNRADCYVIDDWR